MLIRKTTASELRPGDLLSNNFLVKIVEPMGPSSVWVEWFNPHIVQTQFDIVANNMLALIRCPNVD